MGKQITIYKHIFLLMRVKTTAYDVIDANVFQGKIMTPPQKMIIPYLLLILLASEPSLVRFCRDPVMISYKLPSTVSFYHIFSHTAVIYYGVCAFCRNNLISFSILSAVLWKIAEPFPKNAVIMHIFNIQSGLVKSTIFKERNVTSQLLQSLSSAVLYMLRSLLLAF